MSSMWVAGVDGCASGWVVCLREHGSDAVEVRRIRRLEELLEEPHIAVIGIDIPIGLPVHYERGGRACDRRARKLLGARRGSSVFPCPARAVLEARSYDEALERNRDEAGTPVGLSKQCFHLLPKIREVDRCLSPELQERVREVHPELVFYELNREAAIVASKKSEPGRRQRLALLEAAWQRELEGLVEELVGASRASDCARDDVVDAMAVCWTAERILQGTAISEPAVPERDERGLRMEIVR